MKFEWKRVAVDVFVILVYVGLGVFLYFNFESNGKYYILTIAGWSAMVVLAYTRKASLFAMYLIFIYWAVFVSYFLIGGLAGLR